MYRLKFTKLAVKDIEKLKEIALSEKAKKILNLMRENPFVTPPPYEKLIGDLKGLYSRRINIKHRIIYNVREKEKVIVIIRMWNHYE